MKTIEKIKKTKAASKKLLSVTEAQRKEALGKIADALIKNSATILSENQKDIKNAKKLKLKDSLIDRLTLTEERIIKISQSVLEVAKQDQVVGTIVEDYKRPNGLVVQKQRIPIGVIGMIFESRPNVIVDGAALAIKSGNAIIMKGGKEAKYTNDALGEVIMDAIKKILPSDCILVLDSMNREAAGLMLTQNDYIDLIIPRGGEKLIEFVVNNATVPVIAHYKGLCHLFVNEDANLVDAQKICINAKVQRPGVCNAMETLLVHEKVAKTFLPGLLAEYEKYGIEVRGCDKTYKISKKVKKAKDSDWDTEHLDKILNLKIVKDIDEAIEHIGEHGTLHTEGILSESAQAIEKFQNEVMASCIVVNSSTRFNDGGELGLGAELGISTTKLHAFGPMGAKEMTTTRFLVKGQGQIRN